MGAAYPSSASTPVPVHAQLPAFSTIPLGGIVRAMGDSFAQDVTQAKKPKVESLEIAMVNMATMMDQQAAQMSQCIGGCTTKYRQHFENLGSANGSEGRSW
jgi:hypothetical protein